MDETFVKFEYTLYHSNETKLYMCWLEIKMPGAQKKRCLVLFLENFLFYEFVFSSENSLSNWKTIS